MAGPPSGTPPNLAGVPDVLIFFCFFSSIKTRKGPLPRAGKFGRVHREQPKVSNLAGVPDALIFFCFFSCIKARKEEGSKQKSHEKQIKGRRFTPHIRGQGVGLSCLAPKSIRKGSKPSADSPESIREDPKPSADSAELSRAGPIGPIFRRSELPERLLHIISTIRNLPNQYRNKIQAFGTFRQYRNKGYKSSELPGALKTG